MRLTLPSLLSLFCLFLAICEAASSHHEEEEYEEESDQESDSLLLLLSEGNNSENDDHRYYSSSNEESKDDSNGSAGEGSNSNLSGHARLFSELGIEEGSSDPAAALPSQRRQRFGVVENLNNLVLPSIPTFDYLSGYPRNLYFLNPALHELVHLPSRHNNSLFSSLNLGLLPEPVRQQSPATGYIFDPTDTPFLEFISQNRGEFLLNSVPESCYSYGVVYSSDISRGPRYFKFPFDKDMSVRMEMEDEPLEEEQEEQEYDENNDNEVDEDENYENYEEAEEEIVEIAENVGVEENHIQNQENQNQNQNQDQSNESGDEDDFLFFNNSSTSQSDEIASVINSNASNHSNNVNDNNNNNILYSTPPKDNSRVITCPPVMSKRSASELEKCDRCVIARNEFMDQMLAVPEAPQLHTDFAAFSQILHGIDVYKMSLGESEQFLRAFELAFQTHFFSLVQRCPERYFIPALILSLQYNQDFDKFYHLFFKVRSWTGLEARFNTTQKSLLNAIFVMPIVSQRAFEYFSSGNNAVFFFGSLNQSFFHCGKFDLVLVAWAQSFSTPDARDYSRNPLRKWLQSFNFESFYTFLPADCTIHEHLSKCYRELECIFTRPANYFKMVYNIYKYSRQKQTIPSFLFIFRNFQDAKLPLELLKIAIKNEETDIIRSLFTDYSLEKRNDPNAIENRQLTSHRTVSVDDSFASFYVVRIVEFDFVIKHILPRNL